MHYLIDNWSFDPFLVIALVLAGCHEAGLVRLARKSPPEPARERRLKSLWFYAGLVVLLIAVDSPIDYWSGSYFFVHMIQHLLLMFAAPVLIVAGAPWLPLLEGLTGGRGLTRPIRWAGRFLLRPWVAVIAFNATMVFWHLPGPFDLAVRDHSVQIWL